MGGFAAGFAGIVRDGGSAITDLHAGDAALTRCEQHIRITN
jgi:hypothetical protein